MKIKTYDKRFSRFDCHSIKLRSKSHGENDINLEIFKIGNIFRVQLSKPVTIVNPNGWLNVILLDNKKVVPGIYTVTVDSEGCRLVDCNGGDVQFRVGHICRVDGLAVTAKHQDGDKQGTFEVQRVYEVYEVGNCQELATALSDSSIVCVEAIEGHDLIECNGTFSGGDCPPARPLGSSIVHTMHHLNYVETGDSVVVESEIYRWDDRKSEWVLHNTHF